MICASRETCILSLVCPVNAGACRSRHWLLWEISFGHSNRKLVWILLLS